LKNTPSRRAARRLKKLEAERKKKEKGKKPTDGITKAKCKICMMQVVVTLKNTLKLDEHIAARHAKCTLADCFPDETPEARALRSAAAKKASAAAPKYKPDKPLAVKKKKKKRK